MPILIRGDRGTPIMTTNEEILQSAKRSGSRSDLVQSLADNCQTRVAFFESKNSRDVYYSRDETASPYSPIVKLFLSGVLTSEIWRIYRNYEETNADMGTSVLCGGLSYLNVDDPRDDGLSSNENLRELINDSLRYYRFNLVSASGLKDLMRRDFPLYVAPGPNVDIRLETPSTKDTHDGFHTVHRLYMATAFRILRNKQNPGGREGVAALLVEGSTGRILAWALKNPAHPALHAESSSILAYGDRLPADVRIYSTLKPCAMCAGWITTLSGGGHLVYYGQNDATSAAAETFLDNVDSKLLDGRRQVPGVRGIVPIYAGGRKADVTLAEMLDAAYRSNGSPIVFATSDEARTIYGRSDRMLWHKIQKYRDDTATGRNRNVWAALSYLTGFLNSIGVGTANVAQPPVPAAPMDTREH